MDGNVLFAPSLGGLCYVVFYFLFSSIHCFCFLIFSFFAKINNMRARTRPDRTNAGGDRNAGQNSGSTDACHVMLFVLYSIYSFFFSLFFFSVVYSTTTGGAGQGATDRRGRHSNTGRDKEADEREEEVERLGWRSKGGGGRRRGEGRSRD